MTVLTVHASELWLGGPVPADATVTIEYRDASGPLARVDGADVIFSKPIVVAIRGGEPVTPIDAPPTLGVCFARVWVTSAHGAWTRDAAIPITGPVDIGELKAVSPETFQPTADVVAAWEAAVAEVYTLRASLPDGFAIVDGELRMTTVGGDTVALGEVVGADGATPALSWRTSGGYLQVRADTGAWTNAVPLADIKGGKGDPGSAPVLAWRVSGGYVQVQADAGAWTNVVALTELAGPPGADGKTPGVFMPPVGAYFGMHRMGYTIATRVANTDTSLGWSPLLLPAGVTVDRAAIGVTTADPATQVRLVVFTAGADGAPAALVGSVVFPLTVAGNIELPVNWVLPAGAYWVRGLTNGLGAGQVRTTMHDYRNAIGDTLNRVIGVGSSEFFGASAGTFAAPLANTQGATGLAAFNRLAAESGQNNTLHWAMRRAA